MTDITIPPMITPSLSNQSSDMMTSVTNFVKKYKMIIICIVVLLIGYIAYKFLFGNKKKPQKKPIKADVYYDETPNVTNEPSENMENMSEELGNQENNDTAQNDQEQEVEIN
jgi:flagellar basal body-associated protein FliL